MARIRVHQHVNPLAPFFRRESEPIDLSEVFSDPAKPLHLDVGCARGRFLLKMAEAVPEFNYLGVEIRHQLVDEANRLAIEAGMGNLRYEFCNAMLWIGRLLEKLPDGMLQTVMIQFPDPWFKKKHAKRRMVTPDLVNTIEEHLAVGGRLFIQTDIEFLAEEMFELFRMRTAFKEIPIVESPFPVKTEREIAVESKGLPVYRALWERV
ncbi:MAG: tRNA (guanosine(46)-N7)-methyltransferase TrmB [Acidobacteriota bacterium]|nr:MAG: tRNA (guanosine(46)-N7)-methyltransferase TrmB [Acidobacteriota bacterium]